MMLPTFLMFLLSAAAPASDAGDRFPEAVEVYRCLFDDVADKDFDTWPDNWTRQRGYGFPSYMKVGIQPESSPGGENCLRIDLDGGGAAVFSPPIPINMSYGYALEAYVRTDGLKHDAAFVTLTFLDAEKHTLSSSRSEEIVESNGWKKIRLGTVETVNPDARWIVVGLHVESNDASFDLRGTVCFSDIWVGRLPKMEMKTNHPQNFFMFPADVKIAAMASGLDERFSEVDFELIDILGNTVAKATRPLAKEESADKIDRYIEATANTSTTVYASDWTPSIPAPGFYRLRMALRGEVATADHREITLVAVEPRMAPPHGIFGWSLPEGDQPLPLPELAGILENAGISWVKYPVWCSEEDGGKKLEQILQFTERLSKSGIELVAMLLEPPESSREQFGDADTLTAADVFGSDPKNWFPSLEPIMIQMSNRVRYWQLGSDFDKSLTIVPNYIDKIKSIRDQLDNAMQGIFLGIGWDWMQKLPPATEAAELPWNFVSISSDPPPTVREMGTSLDSNRQSPLKPWVVLSPPSKKEGSLQKRAEDLVSRMITAKIHDAQAVFCPDPFSLKRGLMNPDGTPGELFMPWRTTALEIGGGKYIGEMFLPHGAQNRIFLREKDAVMCIWSKKPVEETIFLGENVKRTDIWGRSADVLGIGRLQVVKADRQPTFFTGLNKPIAQWCVEMQLEKKRLPNLFGQSLPNSLVVTNSFPETINGKATIVAPRGWLIKPETMSFHLAPNESLKKKFDVILTSIVTNGRNLIRIDFTIETDKVYRFSVFRPIDVGTSDIRVEAQTRLLPGNVLEVEQHFINESDKTVNFQCELTAPNRRRLITQVRNQEQGENVQYYQLENGRSLLGQQIWIRAQEIDGPRFYNYQFEVEDPSDDLLLLENPSMKPENNPGGT